MVELSMITPSLFLNVLTASVCPQMDLCLQAQRGPLLGSPVNHRSWPLLCRCHSGDWNYLADATRPCLGLLQRTQFFLLATSVQRPDGREVRTDNLELHGYQFIYRPHLGAKNHTP